MNKYRVTMRNNSDAAAAARNPRSFLGVGANAVRHNGGKTVIVVVVVANAEALEAAMDDDHSVTAYEAVTP